MQERMERLAQGARRALGLALDEKPGQEQLEWLIEQDPTVRLVCDPACHVPLYEADPGGVSVLRVPPHARPWETAHEWSHHLRGDGLGVVLRTLAQLAQDWRLMRQAEAVGRIEEAGAQAFVTALFLPAPLVLSTSDYELAELTGWSLESIQARRRDLLRSLRYEPERFYRVWACCTGGPAGEPV